MEWGQLVLWALGTVVTLQGGIMVALWKKSEDNSKALAKHAQHDAETFVTRVDYRQDIQRVMDKLDDIRDKLANKADRAPQG